MIKKNEKSLQAATKSEMKMAMDAIKDAKEGIKATEDWVKALKNAPKIMKTHKKVWMQVLTKKMPELSAKEIESKMGNFLDAFYVEPKHGLFYEPILKVDVKKASKFYSVVVTTESWSNEVSRYETDFTFKR